jgi:predicted kinase
VPDFSGESGNEPGSEPSAEGPPSHLLRPSTVHDLRGIDGAAADSAPIRELRYPAGDVVLISGLPGSGKSTLIRRAVTGDDVRLFDSEHVRLAFAERLPDALPYPVYRLPVRVAHYGRLALAALAGRHSLVVHDCGTLPAVRRNLTRWAARHGHRAHLLLLDVSEKEALNGQRKRGRHVTEFAFHRHRRATGRLVREVSEASRADGCASVVLLDRSSADALDGITFDRPLPTAPTRKPPPLHRTDAEPRPPSA